MEFNSGVSMFLPDSIGLLDNDFDEEDHEDMVHEQTNQNEIVELIMAAFEGHDEPSDGEDDEEEDDDDEDGSSNHSTTSHRSAAHEHELLNTNNNNNNNNSNNVNANVSSEHHPGQHEIHHRNHLYQQQPLFSTPAVSTPPPLVPPSNSTDVRRFDDHTIQYNHSPYQTFDDHSRHHHHFVSNNNENDLPFRPKSATNAALVHYQNPHRSASTSATPAVQYFDSLATVDLMDPMQNQFMYQTTSSNLSESQNQLNKFRILCNVKDRKITELEERCSQYSEKYNSDIRALKHKVELSERAKYDYEQRYQSISRQCEELIETNNQLQRTVKDSELRIQQLETNKLQLEKKLDEAESLIDSLHRKVNELQRFESISRTQQDCELLLASTREKHEQEMMNLNEKLQLIQMNFQEKSVEVDDLRIQLESACKTNEKVMMERIETINRLNQQLHDCQRQYSDLLTSKSVDNTQHIDLKRQLTRLTEEKAQLEQTCEELQVEVQTLRDRLGVKENELNNDLFGLSTIQNDDDERSRPPLPSNEENPNESLLNENQNLKDRIDEFVANEQNLIRLNEELQEQLQRMNNEQIDRTIHLEQIEQLKSDLNELTERYQQEKRQDERLIEQLREDIVDLDKTKQLYIDVCHEKNSIEDTLKLKFEHELKLKLDDLRRNLEKDFQHDENERQTKLKIQHEKIVQELNLELDRLRTNDDAKSRLNYVEKEFEQLKDDYYQLNLKHKDLLKSSSTIEQENQNLLKTIDELNEKIKDLNECQQNLESFQTRINNYENAVSQYEEYRLKLETNLQKITQQRDSNKMDLRLTREMLTNKENDYQQLEKNFNELRTEKSDLEQRLDEANRALSLADSHLKQEIEKIKIVLEQEYNRRYERDQKQHQQDLSQLRQQLTSEFEKQKVTSATMIIQPSTSAQDVEEVKKMYRTEIDRLYRENMDLNQNQAKLIDSHQKQMQIMKKDLEDGYNQVLKEFEVEQARLQARCEQLKQQYQESQQNIELVKRTHANELTKYKEKFHLEQDQRNKQENLQHRLEHLMKLLEQTNETLTEERNQHVQQENDSQQMISSLQKKIAEMLKQHTKSMDELKRELHQERLLVQKQMAIKPISIPQFVQTDLSINDIRSDFLATVEKLRELFTLEMLALLRLTCKMIFDVHHRVGIAHYMDNLDSNVKKQIQNELIRSRNSMIKEIRRELFEKMTHAMKSQGVPDTTIDTHVFELDRLLSQMAQDCLDSLSTSSSSSCSIYSPSTTSNSSLITPQRPSNRTLIYESSTLIKSKTPDTNSTPLRKSIECLHMTPSNSKGAAPLAPHCHVTLDNDRRPKSASTILLANQPNVLSPRTHKFQRTNQKNFKMKMYRSEDDLMLAVHRQDEDDTLTLTENEKEETTPSSPPAQPNVRALARQFEQKTSSLPDHAVRSKVKTPEPHQTMHHATARTIINEQQEENDDDRLSWPQQVPSTPVPTSGIKKFVRHGLKFLKVQAPVQQRKSPE